MQKFVMKLIKKYNINPKTKKNIIIKHSFSNAFYKKIIDENLPIDPIDKLILRSVNYCGINKIKEKIFLIKKSPKVKKEISNNFSFELLMKNEDHLLNYYPQENNQNNKSFKFSNNNDEILNQIIFQNESYLKNLYEFNNYFVNEFVNNKKLNFASK
jgi:hypothetical protein